MKYLNLDPLFEPFNKSILYESFTFNGGEPHFRILEALNEKDEITICTRIKSFNDLGLLLIANDALRRMPVKSVYLFLPYFPAARQDRVMNSGEALSVKVYAEIINQAGFDQVSIVDPHSDVTPALLNNVSVISNDKLVIKSIEGLSDYVLIAPDGGAIKKVYKLSKMLGGILVVECSKRRDTLTGQIEGFLVHHENLDNRTCVVVDDICDGGSTFLGLAKELQKKNAGDLILIVTHGIFSKGFQSLEKYYKSIYCTDAFSTIEHPALNQIKLKNILL